MERNEDLRNDDARISGREGERVSERVDRTERTNDRTLDDLEVPISHAREAVSESNVVHHDDHPTTGDHIGEAAGGISGVLAGAAIGSLGGPIGTVIGGIAGAIGGWWTGRAISEAASNFSHADDEHFRTDFETRGTADEIRRGNRSYETVRPAYQLGYLASRNPEYTGRSFDEIEPDLQRGWSSDTNSTGGADWADMRDYARTAYVRGAASQSSLTGDSSRKDSLTSTGSTGSIGTGSAAPASAPGGTVGTMAAGAPTWGDSPAATVGEAEGLTQPNLAHGNVSDIIDNGGAFAGTSDVTGAQDALARADASERDARIPRLDKDTSLGNHSQRSEIGPPSSGGNFGLEGGASSSTSDPSYEGANPQGSMTYQSNEPLTSSVNDSAGGRRSESYDNVGERQRELRDHGSDERPGYTDPVAGEGVENIGSSTESPRGAETLNQDPETDAARSEQKRRDETY